MPIFWPVTRRSKRQSSFQPRPSWTFAEGEMVPAGKSILSKSVRISISKSWTWDTPAGAKA